MHGAATAKACIGLHRASSCEHKAATSPPQASGAPLEAGQTGVVYSLAPVLALLQQHRGDQQRRLPLHALYKLRRTPQVMAVHFGLCIAACKVGCVGVCRYLHAGQTVKPMVRCAIVKGVQG